MSSERAERRVLTTRSALARSRVLGSCLALLAALLTVPRGHADEAEATTIRAAQLGPVPYRHGRLNLRDDPDGRLEAVLVDLARRRSGRGMIDRLLDSGFLTVLVSTRLRPMQAGLWGPIFFRGDAVGATLYIDLDQIRRVDLDPTGLETVIHELRHQLDASRAYRNSGEYVAIHRAALSGDRTGSAQRSARRVRAQVPDLEAAEARAWLEPRLHRLDPTTSGLMAAMSGREADD